MNTIAEVQEAHAARTPRAPAIEGANGPPLDYAGLWGLTEATRARLRALGVGPSDRVAVIVPNGPEMATAFLTIASAACCAPLNPSYRTAELEFYLDDLGVALLVLSPGVSPAAEAVARSRGIPVATLVATPERGAGTFELRGPDAAAARDGGFTGPDDIALVLHTSGTTSRPKMVPLSQRNLTASGRHISQHLQLTPADACLNVMPLFHIHGLIGALLSSITAGGAAYCTTGFVAPAFFETLRARRPTFYSAVPTIHQAVLAHATANPSAVTGHALRFIRSSSSSLPPTVMAALERVFGVPMIEAYGMTEASHQMACNPLPPRARKPGSVGVAAGPEIAILDDVGQLRATGERGEVAIRGPNVTAGYVANADANAKAFTHGWFRTGDEGYLDAEGYLFLTGRLKEQINRAGEKISPREIDEVLLQHPAIAQAVTFALPHETLGEAVAAAVVPRPGAVIDEAEVLSFLSSRLAEFKVPQRLLTLDELPKGATGKLQRIGLADKLKARLQPGFVAPRSPLEKQLAALWATALGLSEIGVEDNFFFAGGDSLRLMMLVEAAAKQGLALKVELFATHPTIALQARALSDGDVTGVGDEGRFVELRPGTSAGTLALLPPASGSAVVYAGLARAIGGSLRVVGFESPELHRTRHVYRDFPDMIARVAAALDAQVPSGPLLLGGFSIGAVLAFEIGRVLLAKGRTVQGLVLVDPDASRSPSQIAAEKKDAAAIASLLPVWSNPPAALAPLAERVRALSLGQRTLAGFAAVDLDRIEEDPGALTDLLEFILWERKDRAQFQALPIAERLGEVVRVLEQVDAQAMAGVVVHRIANNPLMMFRVTRTQVHTRALFNAFSPGPAYDVRAALVVRESNEGTPAWTTRTRPSPEVHTFPIENHLEFINDDRVVQLAAKLVAQLAK